MSILAEMLAEFCPNGVELKKVADVTTVARGIRVVRNQLVEEGEFPVYQNSMKPLGYYEKANCPAKTTFVIGAGAAGEIGYCDIDFWAADDCYYFIHTEELDNRYLYHVLLSRKAQICSKVRKASVPRLARTVIENLVIPVPPVEIQHKIVRILDDFTEVTENLKKELEVEMVSRKKQYEYYRDNLLKFDISIPKVKLKDIATAIYRGSGITREQMTEEGIPCVRYGEIYTTYSIWFDECKSHTKIENVANPKYFEYGDILFAITGENVEDIAKSTAYVGNDKCLAGGDIVVLKHNQNPKYLSYVLSTHNAQQQKSKGKIKSKVVHSSVPAIEEIEIPLPDLDVQNRLVKILDNFDAICTDLNIGLPAEIEARQKQYEYYRDLLLTFVDCGNTILTDRQTLIKLLQYVFGTVYVRLGDVATITRGGNFQKKDFAVKGFPCIHYGQIYTNYGVYADKTIKNISEEAAEKSKKAVKNDIVMAVTSENIDDVCKCVAWLGNDEIAVSGHTAIIHHEQNPKFLAYYFHTEDFYKQKKKLAHGTKVIEVTPDKLNDIIIPLPGIEEQERIVSVLDRFDTLCNDLSSGLPAEIEARQKQYEYYRDRLLTFKELSE